MPLYDYECSNCKTIFEVRHPMMEEPEMICTECWLGTLQKVILTAPAFTIKLSRSDIKKVGHLASRNKERMSNDEKEHLDRKHGRKKVKQKRRFFDKYNTKTAKEIRKMTPQQQKEYIEHGT
jgi:putative FmdB family regulatory protein